MYLSGHLHREREPARAAGDQRAVRILGRTGLPIGLQLTGRAFDEATLLRAADAYQRDTGTRVSHHLNAPTAR